MTVLDVARGPGVPMTVASARRLTERIRMTALSVREGMEKLQDLVEEAKVGQAWITLGYPSWTAYLADVFGEQPLRLERDQRREIVAYLSGEGMSTRAIAPIVGSSDVTVRRDLTAGATNVAPAQAPPGVEEPSAPPTEPEDAEQDGTAEPPPALRPAAITGLDGKQYPKPAEPPKPRRKPLPDQFFTAVYDLGKAVERVARLVEDDRFPTNREQVALKHENDLLRTADALAGVLRALHNTHQGE